MEEGLLRARWLEEEVAAAGAWRERGRGEGEGRKELTCRELVKRKRLSYQADLGRATLYENKNELE